MRYFFYTKILFFCFLLAQATTIQANSEALEAALAQQKSTHQDRYAARHPKETLQFFGIQPGMKVAEILPGGGWYTQILLPYLGTEGQLTVIDLPLSLWSNYKWDNIDSFITKRKKWHQTWLEKAQDWQNANTAALNAIYFDDNIDNISGHYDAVLFIRAMHGLSRFEDKGQYLSFAIKQSYKLLKPGGVVGIVQHQAQESSDDTWASGVSGYLKKSAIITAMQKAGFLYEGDIAINENPKDIASKEDVVWRLPPSLRGAKNNPERKTAMLAIGESHRMTLKFRKPK